MNLGCPLGTAVVWLVLPWVCRRSHACHIVHMYDPPAFMLASCGARLLVHVQATP